MCCVTSSDDRAIACSGDSVPASAAFMCVPRMVSTADHSVVRGRQNGGAASDAAIAWKNGYRLFNATSVRIERRNGIPPLDPHRRRESEEHTSELQSHSDL